MQNHNLIPQIFKNLKTFYFNAEKTPQGHTKIYPKRKSPDSSGGFRFKKAKRVN